MAIYELFDQETEDNFTETFEAVSQHEKKKSHFFSTLVTRLCFLLLLLGDVAWFALNILTLAFSLIGLLFTFGKSARFRKFFYRSLLNFRRSIVCALALSIGLFSPPFGIMVACTYFLMYDKSGMDEVIPAPLQAQFKDIFKT